MIYKKAQTATEYLIILAVVIVVALIVVGVMGGIPGVGKGANTKMSKAFWKTTDIALDDYAVSSSGTDTIIIRNNLDSTVTLNNLKINGVELADSNTLSPGEEATLTGEVAACTAGETYEYSVLGNYTDSATSATFGFGGRGHKLEGTCAN